MNNIEKYISIFQSSEAELSFKKSRFIACLIPVENEEQFQQRMAEVKIKYPKATHYCYAVICDKESGRWEKMSDDGEPSGTAGRPILDVVRGSGMTNIMVVVVRYFGGTLLGTGGLVKAYSDTAKEVMKNAQKVCMTPAAPIKVMIDYSYYNQFESKCRSKLIGQTDVAFLEQVEIHLHVPLPQKEEMIQLLMDITARTANIETEENIYIPIPV